MARATCSHRPERVDGARPVRGPATETSLAGETRRQHAHGSNVGPRHGADVARVGHPGPVPLQDARGRGIGLAVPDDLAVEEVLHGQVQAPVAGAEAADRARAGRRVLWGQFECRFA